MEEVFSGQFSINLKFEVPGVPSQEISISEKDMGKRIIIDNRTYEILQIDSKTKELVVQKTGSAPGNVEKVTLRAL
jgi:phage-related protein